MLVLRAIGRFFKKIWDWIKQTAWIQPLLIVGIIFGIIFSIKPIVNGIEKANQKKQSAEVYFNNFQLSLRGDENSDADKLTNAIYNNPQDEIFTEKGVGKKFFLVFVKQNDSACNAVKGGFQYFADNLNKDNFKAVDNQPFAMKTIFIDEETQSSKEQDKSAFTMYLNRNENFFIKASGQANESDYYNNGEENANLSKLATVEEPFNTPTIMLVELDPDQKFKQRGYESGVTEIMFGLDGSDAPSQAEKLLNCWNHSGAFDRNDTK